MALSFTRPDPMRPVPLWVSPGRLYLTADDRVVGEGDTDALYLLVAPGHTIPLADAIRYGLVAPELPEEPASPEQSADEAPVPESEATEPVAEISADAPAAEPEAPPEQSAPAEPTDQSGPAESPAPEA